MLTAEKLAKEAAAATAAATAATSRGRGRRRGRGQGRQRGRPTRGRGGTAAVPPAVHQEPPQVAVPAQPIVIESDVSDTDLLSEEQYDGYTSSEADSEESVEGVPGTYFGGWGHCFHCGT